MSYAQEANCPIFLEDLRKGTGCVGYEPVHLHMITASYIHRFITSLTATESIEIIVLFVLIRYVLKERKLATSKIISAGFFASFATIPYVWFVFPYILPWSRSTSLLVSEPAVFILEGIFYRFYLATDWKTSLSLSLLCNVASYYLPLWMRAHGIWVYW